MRFIGLRNIDALETEEGLENGPLLSVIVAARNEEDQIKLVSAVS